MVKSFLILLLFIPALSIADIFDFVSSGGSESKLIGLTKKIRNLEVKDGPDFEETFNGLVKGIETALEEEKLYCSGEAINSKGKTLPPAQKQFCMRELKKQYLESSNAIFEIKKKYLSYLHQRQVQKLVETQDRLRADIEKNF